MSPLAETGVKISIWMILIGMNGWQCLIKSVVALRGTARDFQSTSKVIGSSIIRVSTEICGSERGDVASVFHRSIYDGGDWRAL